MVVLSREQPVRARVQVVVLNVTHGDESETTSYPPIGRNSGF